MRILVVEDEVALNKALVTILTKNGFSADGVFNGCDGLEYLTMGGNYDGVILDLMMPKMDGMTMLKKVRENGIDIPVLILSAKSELDDKVTGLDSGANDYLTKPFAAKELLARVRAMTRVQGHSADSNLHMGNLDLDRASMTLSCMSRNYQLPNKEYQIMELLMTNVGHIISMERIIERVWGYDSDVEDNVVFVYMSTLRKKLAALESNVELKAIRNVGYMLEEK